MTLERKLAGLFNLTDANWMKHANPLSVWSRYSVLPLLVLAFWSRAWLGWWCLIPCALAVLWMFYNPVLFRKPETTKSWASKAVFGERIYLNRDKVALPTHHCTPLFAIITGLSSLGFVVSVWGVASYSVWATVYGVTVLCLGKSWFLDRMVWLFEDMKDTDPEYQSWEY